MGKARIIKKQERCFIELPAEFMGVDEAEVFLLRDGYYLVSLPLESCVASLGSGEKTSESMGTKAKSQDISSDEIIVLQKLQSIKFNERTPANVAKALTGNEIPILRSLEQKGLANLFKGNKYPDGVYNINDSVYPALRNPKNEEKSVAQRNEATPAIKPSSNQSTPQNPLYSILISKGFLVLRDSNEARSLSETLKADMKQGTVVGVKGFDGSFYVVTREFFERASKSVLKAIGKEADIKTISENSKLETDAVLAVLHHLAESGDVIEKKKGIYAAV
jgi:hypothetical protein